jgi:hypothetical protein
MTDQSPAQNQAPTTTTTGVFALLEIRNGVTRDQVMAVMAAEIRATAQLYLDGKIQQWYTRGDGRGVVFLLNTGDLAEARALIEALPLAQEHLVDEQYISVGPLAQLRLLLAGAA